MRTDPGDAASGSVINTTQAAVLVFFAVAWVTIVALLLLRPVVYDEALRLDRGDRLQEVGVLVVVSFVIGSLSIGVLRRWRWAFWLITVAFIAGIARVPVSILQLTGVLSATVPAWYIGYQCALGVAQFAISMLMIIGWRKDGPWGAF